MTFGLSRNRPRRLIRVGYWSGWFAAPGVVFVKDFVGRGEHPGHVFAALFGFTAPDQLTEPTAKARDRWTRDRWAG